MIPESIKQAISDKLNIGIKGFSATSGGCISNGGKVSTTEGNFFLKWNSLKQFPGMFKVEEAGLQLLAKSKTLRLPETVLTAEVDDWQYILMEFIEQGTWDNGHWATLGEQLASLHQHTNVKYGLDHDNYIGALKQKNSWTESWIDFFIQCRLAPQLQLLREANRVETAFVDALESLYPKLIDLLPVESPALLHGDLWSGNVIMGKEDPFVIDPAVYYGHREVEISFTRLFGGFDSLFYEAYVHHFPLQPGFDQRIELYNLYPLLVHANLFGQSYISRISSILNKYAD